MTVPRYLGDRRFGDDDDTDVSVCSAARSGVGSTWISGAVRVSTATLLVGLRRPAELGTMVSTKDDRPRQAVVLARSRGVWSRRSLEGLAGEHGGQYGETEDRTRQHSEPSTDSTHRAPCSAHPLHLWAAPTSGLRRCASTSDRASGTPMVPVHTCSAQPTSNSTSSPTARILPLSRRQRVSPLAGRFNQRGRPPLGEVG